MKNANNCKMGNFVNDQSATYEITSLSMETSWEYIYQNRDILLRVDQFGPVNAQVYPPRDIMLFKREKDDKFSKWLVWVQCDAINGGQPFTNFFRPVTSGAPDAMPQDFKITYSPHKVSYTGNQNGLQLNTTFLVPNQGTDICMSLSVENTTNAPLQINLTPALLPYVNPAQLAPWDKAEWYLKTAFWQDEEALFCTRLMSASSKKEERRTATLWSTSTDLCSYELSLEKFCGAGDFNRPQAIFEKSLRLNPISAPTYNTYDLENQIYGYPPLYATRYHFTLTPGECRVIKQVLSCPSNTAAGDLPELSVVKQPLRYFNPDVWNTEEIARKMFFEKLFTTRNFRSEDNLLNEYANTWLPLQMYWVASLDRGWPTGMRGTRDCANDFMGVLPVDPSWSKEILQLVFECQRSDGWFPRQISTKGKNGSHDLREFVDGGAFVLEFLYEYLCTTGDFSILDAQLPWLDNDNKSSLLLHAIQAVEYYLNPENIGQHGLCKIRGGDWLDAVNRAGLLGHGESVMVSAQVVMCIEYMCHIAQVSNTTIPLTTWRKAQDSLRHAISTYAYNNKGFFNSVFTDSGEWVFSDQDPDGACRPYVCANAYAILCGAATSHQKHSSFEVLKTLKDETGYKLFYPPIGTKPIETVGRSGSGDGLSGLFENGTPYNHGSHGFLGRALASVENADELLEVLYSMLPFDTNIHPTRESLSPPYAVVNCWQKIPLFYNRGGMPFLTGTIAMALRLIYNWMTGIQPSLEELILAPCCPSKLGSITAHVVIRGKNLQVIVRPNATKLLLNGHPAGVHKVCPLTQRNIIAIPYQHLDNGDLLELV